MRNSIQITQMFRRALVVVAVALTLVAAACGSENAPANEAVPPAQADASEAATAAEEPATTSSDAAEEVAMSFLEAFGAFDMDKAITYLADNAEVSGLIAASGAENVTEPFDELRLWNALLEAQRFEQIPGSCDDMGSGASGTSLQCTFDFQLFGSDELGLGPFSGSHVSLTFLDGEIVRASTAWAVGEFSPQVWVPFEQWVSSAHPKDAAVMYVAPNAARLTEESIQLWEQRIPEYVEAVGADAAAAAPAEQPTEIAPTPDYADDAAWICRPGRDDVCAGSLDITMVDAAGSTEVVRVPHASNAPIDCFYVYPTVSRDPTVNSDLVPAEDEEIFATVSQAARFGSVCDVYVPVYRQITIAGLFGDAELQAGVQPVDAYADVRDAFRHYLANAKAGRGFVLMGHSQGAEMVSRLIQEEIADVPALRDRLVSALVLGLPGSAFPDIPPCTDQGQIGCLLSYATYDAASPPPGLFGGGPAPCTNPAALAGGSATLHPAFVLGGHVVTGGTGGIPFADPASAPEISTAWVGYPDFVTAECVDDGTYGYLSVAVDADPADPRTDDLARCACEALFGSEQLPPEWGLHHLDVSIALDDLVAVVAAQATAYAR
jgi:hypothetical protein